MRFTDNELIQGVIAADTRAISRVLTLVENRAVRARTVQSALYTRTGNAHVVGITGAPGAGKSTLVNEMAREYRRRGKKVAVLAVDPTSPFTGGAVLGDRIRMESSLEDPSVYCRSMATRGALGGLSAATNEAVDILDAAGFELILIETVGVGQGEVDIVQTAQTAVVVLVPGMGDEVQVMKAGIMEIGDLFVINKADRSGANELEKEIRVLLTLAEKKPGEWKVAVRKTVATSGSGVSEMIDEISAHRAWLTETGEGSKRRELRMQRRIMQILEDDFRTELMARHKDGLPKLARECAERKTDPYSAAATLKA